jgi:hypothetical protein
MGYQYVENLKNARDCIIREYEDTDPDNLPDERYAIRLTFFDQEELLAQREAYDKQYYAFKKNIYELWDLVNEVYERKKAKKDYKDILRKYQSKIARRKEQQNKQEEGLTEDTEWDEVTFIRPNDTDVQTLNRSYINEKADINQRIILMKQKLVKTFDNQNPIERLAVEDRMRFLEQQWGRFEYNINPYHIQPGILLDIDITSIKRKKYTLNAMANVLNEFLHGVSKGFMDAAFATFSRRRSTVREDIDQTFFTEALPSGETEDFSKGTSSAPEGIVDVSKDELTEI